MQPSLDALAELSKHLTSIARQTHSPRLYAEMGLRAGVDLRPHLMGPLARIRDMQPVRISDVADVIDSERSTVSRQVSELAALGLVARNPDPTDGRAVILTVTPEGERVMLQIYRAWYAELSDIFEDWSERDQEKLASLLARLDEAISSHFKL